MVFVKMDLSCIVGFYVGDRKEFEIFCLELIRVFSFFLVMEWYFMFILVEGYV